MGVLYRKCFTLSRLNTNRESGEGLDRDIDQLKTWIIQKKLKGWSVTDICISAKINHDMFYRWWNRYLAEGKEASKKK